MNAPFYVEELHKAHLPVRSFARKTYEGSYAGTPYSPFSTYSTLLEHSPFPEHSIRGIL